MALVDPVSEAGTEMASAGQAKSQGSPPIELLGTPLSRIYTHIHPILILAVYARNFSDLVEDPVVAMAVGLLPLAIIQAAWCVLCLPPAGSTAKRGGKSKKGVGAFKGNDAQGKKAGEVGVLEKIVPTFLSLLLTQMSIPILTTLQILLGAPLTTHLPHNLLSSTHMSLLAVFPLIYIHGADPARWLEAAGLNSALDEAFGGSVGVLIGGWLGAVPIPLDWDREWQKWPITVLTGAYLGYVLGKILGGLFKGRRINLE